MSTERAEFTEDVGWADTTGEDIAGKVMGKRTKSAGPVRDNEIQGSALCWPPRGKIVDAQEPTGITLG